jgi:serine/threonine protein kinase
LPESPHQGPLPEPVLAFAVKQIVTGLAQLHDARKVHRDIKAGNVLCDSSGNVKISDFGLTKQLSATSDLCNTFVGTSQNHENKPTHLFFACPRHAGLFFA